MPECHVGAVFFREVHPDPKALPGVLVICRVRALDAAPTCEQVAAA